MRVLGVVAAVVGAALLAGSASADPIPIPPLPPLPAVTVTVPATPPSSPKAPAAPAAPVVPESVQTVTSSPTPAVPPPVGSVTASGTGGSGGAPFAAISSPASPRVDHFRSSRPWIGTTGSKRRRTTTFTFVLRHGGRVVFTVNQVSPACLGVGRFIVAGHAGLNRVHFAGVVRGRPLSAGTYRISIRTASGWVVRPVTLVVVDGPAPSPDELRARRSENVCRAGTTAAAGSTFRPPLELPRPPALTHPGAAESVAPRGPNLHSGILASSVEKTVRAIRPLLVALFALAILLLAVASLPREAVPEPRMHDVLARHRIEFAALGAAALVAAATMLLLG
jgi:type IV secretory pathway TrbD component